MFGSLIAIFKILATLEESETEAEGALFKVNMKHAILLLKSDEDSLRCDFIHLQSMDLVMKGFLINLLC